MGAELGWTGSLSEGGRADATGMFHYNDEGLGEPLVVVDSEATCRTSLGSSRYLSVRKSASPFAPPVESPFAPPEPQVPPVPLENTFMREGSTVGTMVDWSCRVFEAALVQEFFHSVELHPLAVDDVPGC